MKTGKQGVHFYWKNYSCPSKVKGVVVKSDEPMVPWGCGFSVYQMRIKELMLPRRCWVNPENDPQKECGGEDQYNNMLPQYGHCVTDAGATFPRLEESHLLPSGLQVLGHKDRHKQAP